MYNYFMLIGRVEAVTANTVDLVSGNEHLEVLCNFDISHVKIGQMIAVKGTIYTGGLYATRIMRMEREEQ